MAEVISKKLKIKAGNRLFTLHAPADFLTTLQPLPEGVEVFDNPDNINQIHWFIKTKSDIAKELNKVISLLKPEVICWMYYPKGSSKIQTDLTRDKGWDELLAHTQLKWLSLISFDETWSAFAMRLKNEKEEKQKKPAERAIKKFADSATKTIILPEDVKHLLQNHKQENDFFNSLSFSHKREYIEWIVSAKKDETRKKRLMSLIEKLSKQYKTPTTQSIKGNILN